MGTTWGPPGSCRPQMSPRLAPWTLLSGTLICVIKGAPSEHHNLAWWRGDCDDVIHHGLLDTLISRFFFIQRGHRRFLLSYIIKGRKGRRWPHWTWKACYVGSGRLCQDPLIYFFPRFLSFLVFFLRMKEIHHMYISGCEKALSNHTTLIPVVGIVWEWLCLTSSSISYGCGTLQMVSFHNFLCIACPHLEITYIMRCKSGHDSDIVVLWLKHHCFSKPDIYFCRKLYVYQASEYPQLQPIC